MAGRETSAMNFRSDAEDERKSMGPTQMAHKEITAKCEWPFSLIELDRKPGLHSKKIVSYKIFKSELSRLLRGSWQKWRACARLILTVLYFALTCLGRNEQSRNNARSAHLAYARKLE